MSPMVVEEERPKREPEHERSTIKLGRKVDKVDIPNGAKWVSCNHQRIDYYETRPLTRLGSYRSFTKRINSNPEEHTILKCDIWHSQLEMANLELGIILKPGNFAKTILEIAEKCETVRKLLRSMVCKESDECFCASR